MIDGHPQGKGGGQIALPAEDGALNLHLVGNRDKIPGSKNFRQLVGSQRRAFYYASKVYTQQLQKGDQYDKLRPGYSINLLHFNHFRDMDPHRFFRILIMMDHKTFREYPDFMTLYFVETLKFLKFKQENPRGSGNIFLDNWIQDAG